MTKLSFFLAAACLWARPAAACLSADFERAVIHSSLPAVLPAGPIVADVEFESEDIEALSGKGIRVRVKEMIQGDRKVRNMIAWAIPSSCSRPFANGSRGIIVAIPLGFESGILVVALIEVNRRSGFRLPDGWEPPSGMAGK